MGILDNIPSDPNPLVVTIDFSQFTDGDKLSSAARGYFAKYMATNGQIDPETGEVTVCINDISFYFAHILFEKMKESMRRDASNNIMNAGMQQLQAQLQATQALIQSAELKKV